ncbi:MAG: hypothetical protein AAGC74_08150 [Verrucomicrobiota bacterium]
MTDELSAPEKAELAAYLLGTLELADHWVEDEEAVRRSKEMDSGEMKGLSREEFNRACGH